MTSRMVGSVLTLVILLSSVVGGAAQTYTQMQWGTNKGVTPYAFGANINGAWSNLGTVSSAGVWGLTPSNLSVSGAAAFNGNTSFGDLIISSGNTSSLFGGKLVAYLNNWAIQSGQWRDYFHLQMDNVSVVGGNPTQRQDAEAHGMSIVMTADSANGMKGSHLVPYVAVANIPAGLPDGGGSFANPDYQEVGTFAGTSTVLSNGDYSEGIASYVADNNGVTFAQAKLNGFFSAVNKGTAANTYPYYGYQAYSYGTQQTTFAPTSAYRVDGGWQTSLDLRGNSNAGAYDVYFPNNHSITHDANNTYINSGTSTTFNLNGVAATGLTVTGTASFDNGIRVGIAGSSVGSVQFRNATSGTITLQPTTGALGTVTATLPANTGTIAETNLAQTFSANQTFGATNLRVQGSSTGVTTVGTANSSATDYTATLPANTGTIAETNLAQTFSATQTFSSGVISEGTKPTVTGAGGTCAAGTVTGGALVGTVALTGVCAATNTLALTSMPAATTGYVCDAADRTQGVVNLVQTATTTTGATFTFITGASTGATDVIQFKCLGY